MAKVLLIDDEEGIRLIGQRALESAGLEVIVAETAQGGLALFSKDDFALVITDLKVPGQIGLSLVQDIRKINPDQQVLVISGGDLGTEWFIEAAEKAGNINTLGKPFEIEELIKVVKTLTEEG